MLAPKKVKHRKMMKGNMKGKAYRGSEVSFGEYGLKAVEPGWMTSRQIESARVAITRHVKRGCKVWIRVFPDKPITKKPAETRMGKGKGNPEYWVAVIKPGRMLYEMAGAEEGQIFLYSYNVAQGVLFSAAIGLLSSFIDSKSISGFPAGVILFSRTAFVYDASIRRPETSASTDSPNFACNTPRGTAPFLNPAKEAVALRLR